MAIYSRTSSSLQLGLMIRWNYGLHGLNELDLSVESVKSVV